ncbi:uncharacterized protein LOC123310437 [Coccinella septempunctata]|uniref:uncharacterized protein LOC123310437 n=1 Tax=Coccinella septempunctata TaxID=41139 RepID=UPI001D06348E|nr:uncharacterized protein LOC123310437 [Coccinella septempunctata]
MGNIDEMKNEGGPDLSPTTEASKLLEQALMQMDGIISGNNGSLNAHSPDYGFGSSPSGVREAANNLVTALRNTKAPPSPDPQVLKTLLDWIQQQRTLQTSSRSRHWKFSIGRILRRISTWAKLRTILRGIRFRRTRILRVSPRSLPRPSKNSPDPPSPCRGVRFPGMSKTVTIEEGIE